MQRAGGRGREAANGSAVTANLFSMLGVKPLLTIDNVVDATTGTIKINGTTVATGDVLAVLLNRDFHADVA